MRTLVLAAGILLVAALGAFLLIAHWRSRFNVRELPKRLGVDIQEEANGVTYTQSHQGHTLFKIHASRVVQLKSDGRALLHDVQIELYGTDGKSVDRIVGNEFEYDQKAGTALANGPVEITITRPAEHGALPPRDQDLSHATQNAAHTLGAGQIDVKTSGLTFNQKTGVASTGQRVQFATAQGDGTAVGATFDSEGGTLQLSHNVELNVHRGAENVELRAASASFDRTTMLCSMRGAEASYRGGTVTAGEARILFRPDGSASRLDAHGGFALTTAAGSRVAAPAGWLEFNEKNQPQRGQMLDGVTMQSSGDGRVTRGVAPTADLAFTAIGELKHAHLERGVAIHSEQQAQATRTVRDWRSPVADIDFRSAGQGRQTEIAAVHGTGGVEIRALTQRGNGPASPSRMTADDLWAQFGPHQELSQVLGVGHAAMEQTTAAGARQTTSGDRIQAQFASGAKGAANADIQSATVDGHVAMTDQGVGKPGQAKPETLRAMAQHAVYDAVGQWLHLTGEPRIDDNGLLLTADRVDLSQASGDAFAHGNVKATWTGQALSGAGSARAGAQGTMALGGQGPVHVIAAAAELKKSAGEAIFRGQARMWQQSNSIAAPLIVLNQARQTLMAHGNGAAEPVQLVLLSAGAASQGKDKRNTTVVRARAGDLKYSDAERKALLTGGVTAETDTATIASSNAEIVLLPPGNHAGAQGEAAQVDRIVARGRVQVDSRGRRGTGEQLVYTNDTGVYVLTGTLANPPELTDPVRGTITGQALIFNGRNDSVSIEGEGHKTTTETVAPR